MAGDIKAIVRSDAGLNGVTHDELGSGRLVVSKRHLTEGGWLLRFDFSDGYYSVSNGNYKLLSAEALIGFKKGNIAGSGGLFYGASVWNDERILGARLSVNDLLKYLSVELYGGREIFELWEDGLPRQHFNNWLVGATAAGGVSRVHGRVGVEEELGPDFDDHRGTHLSYILTGIPWYEGIKLFTGGRFMTASEGYNLNAGAHFDVIRNLLGLTASYERSNLPPFFEELEGLPYYTDDRGRLAVILRSGDVAIMAEGGAGRHSFAGKAGVDFKGAGIYGIYRHDRNLDTNAYGGTAGWRYSVKDNVSIEPYATVLYEDARTVSKLDKGFLTEIGGRIMYAPFRWGAISAGGGYSNTPLVGDGGFVGINLVVGGGTGSSEGVPPVLSRSFPSQGPTKFTPAVTPRLYGRLLKEVAGGFSHKDHIGDYLSDVDNENWVSTVCENCHTEDQLFTIGQELSKEVCLECHEDDDVKITQKFEKLAKVSHPQRKPPSSCASCHDEIKNLEAPTGGIGQIIANPHNTEAWKLGGLGWVDHGLRQDATCKVCHADDSSVQYEGHTVPSCNSCHDGLGTNSYVTRTPHPDGWLGVRHEVEAKLDVQSCTTCHTNLSSCRSCHRESGVMPENMHVGFGFMKIRDGIMGHGDIARDSGGALCGVCHSPAEFQSLEKHEPSCKRCH